MVNLGRLHARIVVGRDVAIVRETFNGLTLEGRARLAPGRVVALVLPRPAGGRPVVRRALITNWEVSALGSEGPYYRGFCRWE